VYIRDFYCRLWLLLEIFGFERLSFLQSVNAVTLIQPLNDECVNATIVQFASSFGGYRNTVTNFINATENTITDQIDTLPCTIRGEDRFGTIPNVRRTVWYKWTPTSSLSYDFSTVGTTDYNGNPIFPSIVIYEGTRCDSLSLVMCSTEGFLPYVLNGGKTYYIMIGYESDYGVQLQFKISTTPNPPPNDDCSGAITIPSIVPLSSYTTEPVELVQASPSVKPRQDCDFGRKDVWYRLTPAISGVYDFNLDGSTDSYGQDLDATIGIYRSTTGPCQSTIRIACGSRYYIRNVHFKLTANTTYFIIVIPFLGQDFGGTAILTVIRHEPPNNNLCTNATKVNPSIKTTRPFDTTYAIHDITTDSIPCDIIHFDETFWYKVTNPSSEPISIVTTIRGYASRYVKVFVYTGDSCGNLKCHKGEQQYIGNAFTAGGVGYFDFIASSKVTYYILVATFLNKGTISIAGSTSYMSLIDSRTDNVIQQLRDFDYQTIKSTSTSLNIQATFNEFTPVKSVHMKFDNPRRDFCEQREPYSVFGDTKGNYKNATIQLGNHSVTATPYTQSNCTGRSGTALSTNFSVTGCSTYFVLYFTLTSKRLYPNMKENITLPCNINIGLDEFCPLPISTVRLELRNASNNQIVSARDTYTGEYVSYYLFKPIPNDRNEILSNHSIIPGSYTITAIIDRIKYPSVQFNVVQSTKC
jgi:hypothetical protein